LGAPEEPPAASIQALRSAHDPRTLLVTIRGVIARADAARLGDEIGDLLRATGAELVVCDVGGVIRPDAVTVDAVCRVRLTALRLGCRLRLRHASSELVELLDLMGLCDAAEGDSDLEAERQAEEREHALGIEEECDPRDPSA